MHRQLPSGRQLQHGWYRLTRRYQRHRLHVPSYLRDQRLRRARCGPKALLPPHCWRSVLPSRQPKVVLAIVVLRQPEQLQRCVCREFFPCADDRNVLLVCDVDCVASRTHGSQTRVDWQLDSIQFLPRPGAGTSTLSLPRSSKTRNRVRRLRLPLLHRRSRRSRRSHHCFLVKTLWPPLHRFVRH